MLSDSIRRVTHPPVFYLVRKVGFAINEIGYLIWCLGERHRHVGTSVQRFGTRLRIWAYERSKQLNF